MRRELAGEKRVSGTLTDERNALKEKVLCSKCLVSLLMVPSS